MDIEAELEIRPLLPTSERENCLWLNESNNDARKV
jgi:hypothetical protein